MTKQADPATLSFEDALAELEMLVATLETGKTKLEDSISAYERGMTLKKHCEKKLVEAQEKIEKLTVSADGTITASPFVPE